ncbi:MAG: hypothetical protein U0401_08220 [Anaerolineae bacterium]
MAQLWELRPVSGAGAAEPPQAVAKINTINMVNKKPKFSQHGGSDLPNNNSLIIFTVF